MSPAKKPPRPVTAWFALDFSDESIDSGTGCDSRVDDGDIRCRIVPIRPPTDAEITKLALHLANVEHAAMVAAGHRRPGKVVGAGSGFIAVAREAWKRGAR